MLRIGTSHNLHDRMTKIIPNFIIIILVIQPILDMASYWVQQLHIGSSITLALRMLILCIAVAFAFYVDHKKGKYYIAIAIGVIFWIGHVAACIQVGYNDFLGDTINYIRVIQMPILVLCFISFMKANKESFSSIEIGFVINYIIILLSIIIGRLSGTESFTYPDQKIGFMGWYATKNAQAAIVCMLIPVVLLHMYRKKSKLPFVIISIICMIHLYLTGTRIAFWAMLIITVGFSIVVIANQSWDWKKMTSIWLTSVVLTSLIGFSPMNSKQNDYKVVVNERQESINNSIIKPEQSNKPNSVGGNTTSGLLTYSDYKTIYSQYCSDLINKFGLDSVLEKYNYSTNVYDLTNARFKKITYCQLLMEKNDTILSKLFGLELSSLIVGQNNYDVENDIFGIFFLYGLVGLLLFALFVAYFLFICIKALFVNAKKYFSFEAGTFGISFVFAVITMVATAGILRRPNASIYLSIILALFYYLVKVKDYSEDEIK